MNERNARLLRKYIKSCGPGRLPERIEENGSMRPNPILTDLREVFNRGSGDRKRWLADKIRSEMPAGFPKRVKRTVRRDWKRGVLPLKTIVDHVNATAVTRRATK